MGNDVIGKIENKVEVKSDEEKMMEFLEKEGLVLGVRIIMPLGDGALLDILPSLIVNGAKVSMTVDKKG